MGTTTIEALQLRIEASATKLEKDMAKANILFDRGAKRMEAQAKSLGTKIGGKLGASIQSSFSGFALKSGGMLAAAFSVDKLFGATQSYARIKNQLSVAGLSGDKLGDTFDQLYEIAQKQGAPLETLVELYSKAAQAQDNLGASSDKLIAFSDAVAQALRVSGKSASESSGALLQLGQAISGNVIQSQEYNSLIDGAYPLLQAAAAGIKEAGGSVSTLTKLVKDGKVAAKAFFDGILAGSSVLTDKLAGAQDTAAQSTMRMGNSLIAAVGKVDKAVGLSASVIASLNASSAYIDANADDWAAWAGKVVAALSDVNDRMEKLNALRESNPGYYLGMPADDFEISAPATKTDLGGDTSESIGARVGVAFDAVDGAGKASTPEALVKALAERAKSSAEKVTPVSLADYKLASTKTGKTSSRESDYDREVSQIQERTAAIKAETEAQAGVNPLIDDYGYALDYARVKQDLLTAAQKSNRDITPEMAAAIDDLAQQYASASSAAQELAEKQGKVQESYQAWLDTEKSVVKGVAQDLLDGASAADVLSNALGKVADKLLDDVLDAIFQVNGASGGGNFLSSIFSGLGSLFGKRDGGAVTMYAGGRSLPAYDTGGQVSGPGGPTSDKVLMWGSNGEFMVRAAMYKKHKPLVDAINADRLPGYATGGRIGSLPALASGGLLSSSVPSLSSSAGTSSGSVHVDVGVSVDNNGNLTAFVKNISQQTSEKVTASGIDAFSRRGLPYRLREINANPNRIG